MDSLPVPGRRRRAALLVVVPLLAVSCSTSAPPADPLATPLPSVPATTTATTATTSTSAPAGPSTTAAPAPTTTQTTAAPSIGAIVVDHTTIDPAAIPDRWLAAAQETVVWAYGSTSHGTQLWAGAQDLADHQPRLRFTTDWRVFPEGDGLPMAYDDGWSWDPATFTDDARALLADVPEATTFMWSWCGELSNPNTDLEAYLDGMTLLRTQYPEVTFVFMTGHTDGGSPELAAANDRIREWVQDTGGVLFDFADIERFDPDGAEHPDTDDSCLWCAPWCAAHPEDCAGLGDVDCAHSHPLICRLKAGALWWLSARLAGWEGDAVATP